MIQPFWGLLITGLLWNAFEYAQDTPQKQRVGADHDPLEVVDLAHQAAGFVIVAGIRVEIGTHPVLRLIPFPK